jgi:hypothetical protein
MVTGSNPSGGGTLMRSSEHGQRAYYHKGLRRPQLASLTTDSLIDLSDYLHCCIPEDMVTATASKKRQPKIWTGPEDDLLRAALRDCGMCHGEILRRIGLYNQATC